MILNTIANEIYVPLRNQNLHACVEETRYEKYWDKGGIIGGVTWKRVLWLAYAPPVFCIRRPLSKDPSAKQSLSEGLGKAPLTILLLKLGVPQTVFLL
jgi:hypothetical protein